MEASTNLKERYSEELAHSMNEILTDEFALCIKTRQAHSSPYSPEFHSEHVLFERQYRQLEDIIDDITERIRNFRFVPSFSMAQNLDLAHPTEHNPDNEHTNHIGILLAGHERILIRLREKIGSYASTHRYKSARDYVSGLLEVHLKMAWLLQAHLE